MLSPQVLVFGEDDNDREVLRILITSLCPPASGRVAKRKKPLLLARGATPDGLEARAKKLAATIRADEAIRPVACVFVHEDADDYAPADRHRAGSMEAAAAKYGAKICAVVPAWETEAWFFLFPGAVAETFPSWTKLKSATGRVDRRKDAKEAFRSATTPKNAKRRYEESDGPKIAATIAERDEARSPVGISDAYQRFIDCVDACCELMAAE